MKKFLIISLFLFVTCNINASAQSISRADDLYQQYILKRSGGAPDAGMHMLLYQSYTEYVSVLTSSVKDSNDYVNAKDALIRIHPSLYNGAAYFNNRSDKSNAMKFAYAYVDLTRMEAFKDELSLNDGLFADITYLAASFAYQSKDYNKAIDYFAIYLETDDTKHREQIYSYLAYSYYVLNDFENAKKILKEGIELYPTNYNMLTVAVRCWMYDDDRDAFLHYITLSLAVNPNDEFLLYNQALLYEQAHKYSEALDIYHRLNYMKPDDITINEHIAQAYFNKAVLNYHKSLLQETPNDARAYSQQAKECFTSAVSYLEVVVDNTRNPAKYLRSLAISYDCLGNTDALADVNKKLANLGVDQVEANQLPIFAAVESVANVKPSYVAQSSVSGDAQPAFMDYANNYVEERIQPWLEKDPYETTEAYHARVNKDTFDVKARTLIHEAEVEYINKYAKRIQKDDMVLRPYDADNQVFLVESEYGELIVPVPRDKNEARIFENSWNVIKLEQPEFYISNNEILLSGLTFVTPAGTSYRYDGEKDLSYTETVVSMSYNYYDSNLIDSYSTQKQKSNVTKQTVVIDDFRSDVDIDIPTSVRQSNNTFVVIIANEKYKYLKANVEYASADGESFKQYCLNTLGIPETNIHFKKDASLNDIKHEVKWITDVGNAYKQDAKLILYYAGHGIPDESSLSAYLLPSDGYGNDVTTGYKLADLYASLSKCQADAVVVLLDACFSGVDRSGSTIESSRGVALKVNSTEPAGNVIVLSAASGDETAHPYREKRHGLFTYFILKKLKETNGNVTLGELFEDVKTNVSRQSVVANSKKQSPNVIPSPNMMNRWRDMTLY